MEKLLFGFLVGAAAVGTVVYFSSKQTVVRKPILGFKPIAYN